MVNLVLMNDKWHHTLFSTDMFFEDEHFSFLDNKKRFSLEKIQNNRTHENTKLVTMLDIPDRSD